MLYYINVFEVSLVALLILQAILRKTVYRLSKQYLCYIFFVISVISGLLYRKYIYLKDTGIYFFMDYSFERSVKTIWVLFIIDAFLLLIILFFHIYLIKGNKDYLFVVKGIKFLPLVSLKWLSIVLIISYSVLGLSDTIMPQYGYWRTEDVNIFRANTHVHEMINNNYIDLGYPLAESIDGVKSDEKRILVIGDSFIWGDGSSNVNNLWWKMLQRKIAYEGYNDCRIIAVGYCGASTQDQLNWIKNTSLISDIHPDMIVFGYVTNDAQYVDENDSSVPVSWSPDSYIETSRILGNLYIFFPNIASVIDDNLKERKLRKTDLSQENKYDYDTWEKVIVSGDYLEGYYSRTLKPLSDTMDDLGIPYCFVTTPNTPSYEAFYDKYVGIIGKFEDAGITIYDCLKDFVEKHGDDEAYFQGINPVNAHPGVATNSYIAGYVFDILQENYTEALGERNSSKNVDIAQAKINDWYPDAKLNPVCNAKTVSFNFSDAWNEDKYLYLPMMEKSVKMCFEYPINLSNKKIVIKDEDGNIVDNFKIRASFLNDMGYEEFSNKIFKIKGLGYVCEFDRVTSLNISGDTKGEEHTYVMVFE